MSGWAVSADSTHPNPAHAAGECAGTLLDGGVHRPDLLVVLAAGEAGGRLGDVARLLTGLVEPRTVIGASPGAIVAGGTGPTSAGISVLSWSGPDGADTAVRPIRLGPADLAAAELGPADLATDPVPAEANAAETGPPDASNNDVAARSGVAFVLADPFSVDDAQIRAAFAGPELDALCGGYVAASTRRGGNRLLLDGEIYSDGLVGVSFDTDDASIYASSGGVLLGTASTVTDAEGASLRSLDGAPAVARFAEVLIELGVDLDPIDAITQGALHLACETDRVDTLDRHDPVGAPYLRERFAPVKILGVDFGPDGVPTALQLEREVPAGTRVYFEHFGPNSLDADLARQRVERGDTEGPAATLTMADTSARGPSLLGHPGDYVLFGPTAAALCSGVFERRDGSVAVSEDRVVSLCLR